MIASQWKFGSKVEEVTEIRASVNISPQLNDEKSMHLIIYDNEIPAGCGSLYFDNDCYHIACLSVKPEFQKQFIGDLMIRVLLVRAFNMMAERIEIVATPETKAFFKKYGFSEIDGDTLNMFVTPETLVMNSKCGHDCSSCINKEHCGAK